MEMNFDPESVLEALNEFGNKEQTVTPILDEYLLRIAKTGNILFPWCKLKPLLKRKVDLVLSEFWKGCPSVPSLPNTEAFDYENLKKNIMDALDMFQSAPFTIQRLCELVTNPRKHYNRTDKYMRGLEKNLLVVTTVEPAPIDAEQSQTRNQPAMVNGGIVGPADSTNDEHTYDNSATGISTPVNGTVLENFATVFPTATRIASPANNIQVAIVTGASTYQETQTISTFTYCTDSGENDQYTEVPASTTEYDNSCATYCQPDGNEYIVVEQYDSSQDMSCIVEEGVQTDVNGSGDKLMDCGNDVTAVPDKTDDDDDNDDNVDTEQENQSLPVDNTENEQGEEPDPKRRKMDDSFEESTDSFIESEVKDIEEAAVVNSEEEESALKEDDLNNEDVKNEEETPISVSSEVSNVENVKDLMECENKPDNQ